MKRIILVVLVGLIPVMLSAQSTRIRGKVTDAETGEEMPFVNIFFTGTTIGTSSDLEGMYSLETRQAVKVITASFIGYEVMSLPVNPGTFNQIDFKLQPQSFELNEVVINPGESKANPIIRNVIRNKKINNPDKLESYSCNTYTKMELDLTNMKSEFKNKKMQKNFGFVFNYMDTSAITGNAYLPVMISESYAENYFRKSPPLSKEVIKASRISGIEEDYTLAQFTGNLVANINFYDNYIGLFNVQFPSPISDHAFLYYNFFLIDSIPVEGRKTYKVRFHPKSSSMTSPVLDGELMIDSLSWGVKSVNAKMAKRLNVNWIRHLVMDHNYQLLNDTAWFPERSKLFADFSLVMSDSSKLVSFLGQREVNYSDVKLNYIIPEEVKKLDNNIIISKDVLKSDEEFWEQIRPYELSGKEKQIYSMVDSIKNAPLFQNIYTVITTIFGGYYETKYLEYGPYFKLASHNKLEGMRFQLGARTTADFSKKLRLSAYGAYGLKDEKFKGSGSIEYVFNNMPTSKLHLEYKYDALQLGAGVNAFTQGNVLNSLFSKGDKDKLSIVEQGNITYQKEWRMGFENTFGAKYRNIHSSDFVPLVTPGGEIKKEVKSLSAQLKTRLSRNERVARYNFEKYSLGSKYPIFEFDFSMGIKGVFKEDYEYYRLEGNIYYNFDIPPFGNSKIAVNAGQIFGKVPYPLLKIHEGNATFFYDPYAYSCMNYYEFASDKWVSFLWEHHFRGFFLGKIPLMKRLNWREVFVLKGVIGTLDKKNNGSLTNSEALLLFPAGMSSVSKPYIEAGIGVENIFRLLRVDAIWRLSHREQKEFDTQNFTVSFSFYLDF